MLPRWLRASDQAREHKQPSQRSRSFLPRLEGLEGRDVPASLLASGLEAPTGSTVGPGGDLYVAEGGAGRIARVDPRTGEVTTFASGLPLSPFVGFGVGAVDVAFLGRTAYVLVTLVGPDVGGDDVVGIYRVDGPDRFTVVADIGAWSEANPPATDIFVPTGSQYAMEPYRGGFLVTDGHHNRVLHVELDGGITEVIAFDNIVPTGLEVRGDTVYMAQAGPVPHVPADGKVVSFRPRSATAREVASGSPLLVDVEFGRGNSLYALSQGDWEGTFEGDPAAPDTGALVRVNRDGTFTTVEDGLDRPSSLEFIGNTAYVVSLSGEVWRIDDVSGPPFGDGRRSVAGLSTLPSSGGADGIRRDTGLGVALGRTAGPGGRQHVTGGAADRGSRLAPETGGRHEVRQRFADPDHRHRVGIDVAFIDETASVLDPLGVDTPLRRVRPASLLSTRLDRTPPR
jgi:sugar lactone lactonase YvrE